MSRAKDEKRYYKIVTDNDLNYSKFFTQGNKKFNEYIEYNSFNTSRLNDKELMKVLINIGVK